MIELDDNRVDDHVDDEIYDCLDIKKPKSFFLFAGAGSGKTRSLVTVLQKFKAEKGADLQLSNQKVAIITYTNAACDEITRRLDYDSLFSVSTIHSFVWELIKPFQHDIREWLRGNLVLEIEELEEKQRKGRGGDAAEKRIRQIAQKTKRLHNLDTIRVFSYNPNGDNFTRDSLNHSEVIKICSYFLSEKSLMRKILVRKFPVLLIDESQDTNKDLMNSFFSVQESESSVFSLGLFGDVMQRIYFDGKPDLGKNIPQSWATPAKEMNHRCPKRVVRLINQIRFDIDGQEQRPRSDSEEGYVRLFVVPSSSTEKSIIEDSASQKMHEITSDDLWIGKERSLKTLTLEHHMAAKRMGFFNLFEPLYRESTLKTSLLDGSLAEMRFFSNIIIPLKEAYDKSDKFRISQIVKENSPLLKPDILRTKAQQTETVKDVNRIINGMFELWDDESPTLIEIISYVKNHQIFHLTDNFEKLLIEIGQDDFSVEQLSEDNILSAWFKSLQSEFAQIVAFDLYISDEANFGTHQGVKGLEFPRVMVILDDEDAGGFMFSYEKLFGAKALTATDQKNIAEGKDSSIDRTRRLFYVTCSRAEKSLAVVAYTNAPDQVKEEVLTNRWFEKDEIYFWNDSDGFSSIT